MKRKSGFVEPWVILLVAGLSFPFSAIGAETAGPAELNPVSSPLLASHVPWRVGIARRSITPRSPMWMAGYAARDHVAEGKTTDLWAKVLILEDRYGRRGVLVTLDLVGIDRELGLSMRQQIATRLQLSLDRVMLCASHTHSGPVVSKNLSPMHFDILTPDQQQQVVDYTSYLQQQVIEGVEESIRNMHDASLFHGTGNSTIAVNRRNNPEGEVSSRREVGTIVGPFDHDVPVLAIQRDGQICGIVFGYACHATVLDGYQWSGDYPGHAQLALEERYPNAVAMFWAGCGADQNPIPRRQQALAEQYGTQLADSVREVLTGSMIPVSADLHTNYTEIPLVFDEVPTRVELQQRTESENRYEANRARSLLQQLDAGIDISRPYPFPIGTWRLGGTGETLPITWHFLGGEVVVDYALRMKQEHPDQRVWIAGYSNDVMAYIPSRRVLLEGGYEGGTAMVYYGLPASWHPQIEERIFAELRHH